jgi:hypothetical protein
MWGRGLRSSPETGKADCILLDHSGNVIRFAEDFERIYFNGLDTLDMGQKLDKAVRKDDNEDKEDKACPACGHRPFVKRCMACGHTWQPALLIEAQAGAMRDVVMLRGKKMGENESHVWAQVAAYARCHSPLETQQGRAARLFHHITGHWPPPGWHVKSTPGVAITHEVLNKIKQLNIAYSKARQALTAV